MKIYISADLEGITGIAHWDETEKSKSDYAEFREQMTKEVAAACRGAIGAGATRILLKDAHDTGRNLVHRELPECVELIRGWAGHPLCMVQELEAGFDALLMIGYHSRAGGEGNPLAHTLNPRVGEIVLNGRVASEFLLHAYAGTSMGVPVAFVSGDEALCQEAEEFVPGIATVSVGRGIGNSIRSRHPIEVVREIEAEVHRILSGNLATLCLPMPESFELRIRFKEPRDAYRASQYPGMCKDGHPRQVCFETNDYLEILRALLFVT